MSWVSKITGDEVTCAFWGVLRVFLLLQITGLQHLWFVDKSCHANRWAACLINFMCSCRGRGEPVFPMGVSEKGNSSLGISQCQGYRVLFSVTPVVWACVPHGSGSPQTLQELFLASFFPRPPACSPVAVRNSACLAALPAVVQSCCRCRGSFWSCSLSLASMSVGLRWFFLLLQNVSKPTFL